MACGGRVPYLNSAVAESLYYNWSKDFIEAGKKRLTGDTTRQATSGEVTNLKREARDLNGLKQIRKGSGGAFPC